MSIDWRDDLLKSLDALTVVNHQPLEKSLSEDLENKVKEGQAHWVTVKEGPLAGRHLLIEGARPEGGGQSRGRILAGKGVPVHVIQKITGATHAHQIPHEQDYSSWSDEDIRKEYGKHLQTLMDKHAVEHNAYKEKRTPLDEAHKKILKMRNQEKKGAALKEHSRLMHEHWKGEVDLGNRHAKEIGDFRNTPLAQEMNKRTEAQQAKQREENRNRHLDVIHNFVTEHGGYEARVRRSHDLIRQAYKEKRRKNASRSTVDDAEMTIRNEKNRLEDYLDAAKRHGVEGLPETPDFENENVPEPKPAPKEKPENYHVFQHKDKQFVGVHGSRVKMEGADGLHLFHHKDGKDHVVSDARTGARLASGSSKTKAVEAAQEAINKHGVDKVKYLIEDMVRRFGETPSWQEVYSKADAPKAPKAPPEKPEEGKKEPWEMTAEEFKKATPDLHPETRRAQWLYSVRQKVAKDGPDSVAHLFKDSPDFEAYVRNGFKTPRKAPEKLAGEGMPFKKQQTEQNSEFMRLLGSVLGGVHEVASLKKVRQVLHKEGYDAALKLTEAYASKHSLEHEHTAGPHAGKRPIDALRELAEAHKAQGEGLAPTTEKSLEGGLHVDGFIDWDYNRNGDSLMKSLDLAMGWNNAPAQILEKSVLTKEQREDKGKMHDALSGGRFPMPDAKHARLAYDMASRSENAGNIRAEEAEEVRQKAKARLKELGEPMGEDE